MPPRGETQPELFFETAGEFEAWLEQNHGDDRGIWLRFAKKASGIKSLTYGEALDVALCFGWIDGQSKSIDETWYRQRFTPRRARSPWSKRNVGKVVELTAAGRMRPSGIAEVERAKADGRWQAAYDGARDMEVPEDLQRELDARPAAAEFFASLTNSQRYGFLYRLHEAKRPETRARRLEKFVGMLERGEKLG